MIYKKTRNDLEELKRKEKIEWDGKYYYYNKAMKTEISGENLLNKNFYYIVVNGLELKFYYMDGQDKSTEYKFEYEINIDDLHTFISTDKSISFNKKLILKTLNEKFLKLMIKLNEMNEDDFKDKQNVKTDKDGNTVPAKNAGKWREVFKVLTEDTKEEKKILDIIKKLNKNLTDERTKAQGIR